MPHPHPHKAEAIQYSMDHPELPYPAVGKLFGVHPPTLKAWMSIARKSVGSLAIPCKQTPRPRGASGLTLLPQPAKALDPELTELARSAARTLLVHLADPAHLKDASLRDVAAALKTITDSYELLSPMEGGPVKATAKGKQLVRALLGELPSEEDDEEEEPNAPAMRRTG
jgi:hypothetical protein